jgi:hypothetical protein
MFHRACTTCGRRFHKVSPGSRLVYVTAQQQYERLGVVMMKQRAFAMLGPVLMLWGCLAIVGAAVSGWGGQIADDAESRPMTTTLAAGALPAGRD